MIAGVFGSTFVKTALQLGRAASYVSLDTFPWCPLLRCYWGWRDMCHNCELCYNSGGGGEACNTNGYHTAKGLRRALADTRRERRAFRSFIGTVERDFRCRPFADHPLGTIMYNRPVTGSFYSTDIVPRAPPGKRGAHPTSKTTAEAPPTEVCAVRASASGAASGVASMAVVGTACACGYRRFVGVDNARYAERKPAYGYATAALALGADTGRRAGRSGTTQATPGGVTQAACERACCEEPLCHSVTWRANTSECIASLAIAHGAREDDWCWHPTISPNAVTSIRLHGAWQLETLRAVRRYLAAPSLVRTGPEVGQPRFFRKAFRTPAGHTHPMERSVTAEACEAPAPRLPASYEISDAVAAAVTVKPHRLACRSRG